MNSIYCELCEKQVEIPGFISTKEAKAVHLHAHTSEWIQNAIKYISSKDDDEARCLQQNLEKIQKDFIKVIEDFCPNKDKECGTC